MAPIWERVKSGLVDGYKLVSEKTEELTKIGRLKLDIIATKRDIEKTMIELGGRVYHKADKKEMINLDKDTALQDLVRKIKKYEQKLKKLNDEINHIQNQSK
jgi:hypothetical protein